MTAKRLRPSPLSLGVLVVVVVVAVVGFGLSRVSIQNQNHRLLERETGAAAALGAQLLSGTGQQLDSLATAVAITNGSPSEFEAQAGPSSSSSDGILSFALLRRSPGAASGAYDVVSSVGNAFTNGKALPTQTIATAARADSSSKHALVAAPVVHSGSSSTAGFAARPSDLAPGTVLYEQFTIPTFSVARDFLQGGPFNELTFALYGGPRPTVSSLFVATTTAIPLSGSTASAPVKLGTSTWDLVAQSRTPLAGSLANHTPLLILLLGLLLAVILSGTVEVLVRRQRYAAHLVSERTAELEVSLRDLREAQEKLVRGERLSALGEMASVVGHELRNPLTAVTNALFLLRRGMDGSAQGNLGKHLDMAERETAKATALAEDLTAFVRPRKPVMSEVDVADLVNEVIQVTPPPAAVELAVEASPATVVADRGQLVEVLTNIVTNAYQAVPNGGSVRVSARKNGVGAVIVVEDSGPGIDAELKERLFEPFFTTKATGTGLGLAIVRRLVEAHGGEISIENCATSGARVTVQLPPPEEARAMQTSGSAL